MTTRLQSGMMRSMADSSPTPLHDIADRADITVLVHEFYTRAYRDELLGHVFIDIAQLDLPSHLPIMVDFWETVLHHSGAYHRSAYASHLELHKQVSLTERHFLRWRSIWNVTVDDLFAGPIADAAKAHAVRVSTAFRGRLERYDASVAPNL